MHCFHPLLPLSGSMGGLFMDGEDSATANPGEDISKWSVEDVCGFISSLAGCAEYTQVRTGGGGEGGEERGGVVRVRSSCKSSGEPYKLYELSA